MQKHIHLDGEKSLSYNFSLVILCINYEYIIWRHLFWHICPCFLIYLCVLNEAGTYTAVSELTLLGKAIGEWETGHSPKEKLSAIFPCLWIVFKPCWCLTEEQASNTWQIHAPGFSCAAAR